ncbi:DMT family transporter [Litorisediminicola beolgyonensis]|uniref:DMT family transporter n=1 Tax=Litorisediminicola beolgyonensis TaxID=1173614 RepID=A0ABW3ZLU4_9RHOB
MQKTSPFAPRITLASWAMVAALGVTWGGTFVVIELALRGIGPAWLAAARISGAAIVTVAIWQMLGGRLFLSDARPYGRLAIVGVLNTALPFMLLSWGQVRVTSGFAGVSMAAVALIVLPLAHLFLPGERLTLRRVIGFGIGFLGVTILLTGAGALESSGDPLEPFGRLACLGAAACYASSSVMMRRLPPIDPIGLAAVPLLFGALVVVPVAALAEGAPALPDRATLFWLVLLGLVPTAGANLLRVLVIRTAGPVFMSLVNYQVPVWSVVLGILILNEPAPPTLWSALALILAGVAVSQWAALRVLFRRRGRGAGG